MAEQPFDRYAMFEQARKKASQETTAGKQAANEAIQRRFAQLGMQGSGEAIKQQQVVEQKSQEQLGNRFGEIQAAESAEKGRQADIQEARKFAVGEREAQQKFATGERVSSQSFSDLMLKKQQAFAKGERIDSQAYASEQAALGREFADWQQRKQNQFARTLDDAQGRRWAQQFKEQQRQFDKNFEYEKMINDFNMKMAESEANKKDIFGRIGDMGTGGFKGVQGFASDLSGWG
jgi:hypothetical protein